MAGICHNHCERPVLNLLCQRASICLHSILLRLTQPRTIYFREKLLDTHF